MNDCPCGKPVRLGAMKVTVMRARGVAHYIEHRDGTRCGHLKGWTCSMFKPYPKVEAEKPFRQMLDRWAISASGEQGKAT